MLWHNILLTKPSVTSSTGVTCLRSQPKLSNSAGIKRYECRSHESTRKELWKSCNQRPSRSDIWRRKWHPTPVLLSGESHGRRSLVGHSPWGHEESDMTERLHFHFSLSCVGEGNGNPLQCSCLENPGDRGAWWAAVYGVAQSRTRLKQLSSSSSRSDITLNFSFPVLKILPEF